MWLSKTWKKHKGSTNCNGSPAALAVLLENQTTVGNFISDGNN